MRNLTVQLNKALLFVFCAGAALIASPVAAQGRDFSGGITNASAMPVAGAKDPAWEAQQRAAEAAAQAALASGQPAAPSNAGPGQLGKGDKIKLTVFGEEDLSGEFEIDSTGSLAMPLVGDIPVSGLTPRDLEKKIAEILEKGYLKNPRVNIEVLNFRPFFILGEVNKPGSYAYSNDMSVINAVALGGGYTTRAKIGQVKIRRAASPDKEEWVGEEAKVFPGDAIRVEERFF